MNIIEFHPDDLLDRELRGQLSHNERVRLADHLAQCSTCRLERMMRSDFAAAAEPLRVSQGFASFVTAAISQAQAETKHVETAQVHAAAPVRAQRRRLVAMLVVAAALGVTGAAAARVEWLERVVRAALGEPAVSAAVPARAHRGGPRSSRLAPASAVVAADAAVMVAATEPALLSEQLAPSPERAADRPARASLVSPARALFSRATRLRRAEDVDGAASAYRELGARYPRSPEARRAPVLLGRLLLDVGRAAPALEAFDAYLGAREPALREDALAGRARALAELGQAVPAQRAYAQLLREFPGSSYAAWMERQRD